MKTKKTQQKIWQDLPEAATSLTLATIIAANTDKSFLIIVENMLAATRLVQEIKFFLGNIVRPLMIFPSWETLPYDHFSPHEDTVSQRLLTLYHLRLIPGTIVVTDVTTLMQRLPPVDYIIGQSFVLKEGDELDVNHLRIQLVEHGYSLVNTVTEHGEFAVRGSIIDLFPMGSDEAYRIDLLHTTVDSIRTFDPDTQRSRQNVSKICVLPAQEFPMHESACAQFVANWERKFVGDHTRCPIYTSIQEQKVTPGLEYYLPLFFAHTATLCSYLSNNGYVIALGNVTSSMQKFWQEINLRYTQLCHDQTRPILPPEEIFITPEEITKLCIDFSLPKVTKKTWSFTAHDLQDVICGDDLQSKFASLCSILQTSSKTRVLLVAASRGRKEQLLKLLRDCQLNPIYIDTWQEFIQSSMPVAITIAALKQPMYLAYQHAANNIIVITDEWLLGKTTLVQPTTNVLSAKKLETIVHNLTSLQIGEPVVHIDYGVGRYLGLQQLQAGECDSEFLVLEYAAGDKLYVPVSSLDLITRYTGVDVEHVTLQHLGTKQWDKIKAQAARQIRDTAAELLEIHAQRKTAKGYGFNVSDTDYARFANDFSFVVTPDQKRAIDDVFKDMGAGQIMDRLICGDVGFGKTEVAMRAAFIAANNGKQVALLTPTTLLAKQHYTNFQERFATWPFNIALYSRLGHTQALKRVNADLRNGKVDIIIGTHKVLQKNVRFKDLGLLIIDEEHRFGVRHKDYIKKIAAGVDILTLTATPIPRTLNMAFAGIRDFSVIASPPAKRLAIKTLLCEYSEHIIKEAIVREILRGGQVYFVHNNVASIENITRDLERLVPHAKVAFAHGQMHKQKLERIMEDFYQLKVNVLVCTTIIESGLDVPSANTIIINRAERFGLAELHQLRGRVGRSHRQAYAYLIVPPHDILPADAKKRLAAIAAMRDLGTGFALAINDLEIRGAGELLGEKQSGVIHGIGFALYTEMLTRAVNAMKRSGKTQEEQTAKSLPQIDITIAAFFPDNYISDVNLRLVFYKKIAGATTQEELDELGMELCDRFGVLPEVAQNLFKLAELKLQAQSLGISKITMNNRVAKIVFADDCKVDPQSLIKALHAHKVQYKFKSAQVMEFKHDLQKVDLGFLREVFVIIASVSQTDQITRSSRVMTD